MSAQMASTAASSFTANLVLAAGVSAYLQAPTLSALTAAVAKLQPTEAINDTPNKVPSGNAKGAATAPAGASATATAASSAPPAAAPAAQGDAGNAAAAASQPQETPAASDASSSAPATSLPSDEKEAFAIVKKAFLALGGQTGGREKCEAINKKFGVTKLSENKPENYAAVLAEIQAAGA